MLRRSAAVLQRRYRNVINGKPVEPVSTYGVINPSTGLVFAEAPSSTQEDVAAAVAAAASAQKIWSMKTLEERREAMLDGVARLQEQAIAQELRETLVREQGKPMWGADYEVGATDQFLTAFASIPYEFEKVFKDDKIETIVERRVPLGVVAGILPWDFPLLYAAWKIGEALITGNSIVIKPASSTPLSTLIMVEALAGAFPAGTINCVTGGRDIGRYLVESPGVQKVSFTGSTPSGKAVRASAASDLKVLTMQLSGNDPAIVLDDADVSKVVPQLFNAAFMNSGQLCVAPKRIYVHESKFDEVVEALAEAGKAAPVGDGFEDNVFMGPMNNEEQLHIVEAAVNEARAKGATIHCGGERMDRPGYFYPPTIITGVEEGDNIVDNEQFGPCLPVMKVRSDDEAILRANNSRMGLGASVWTASVERGNEIANRLEAGTVWVNHCLALTPDVPFGGFKESAIGRQMGDGTIEGHTNGRVVRTLKPIPERRGRSSSSANAP